MNNDLRNRLLNTFLTEGPRAWSDEPYGELTSFVKLVVDGFFAVPHDRMWQQDALNMVREHFSDADWNEVYDLLEFALRCPNKDWLLGNAGTYVDTCNRVLKEEHSAYRFVKGVIVQVTAGHEVKAIEAALASPDQVARDHMRKALELFAARGNPNYAKVIQEAFSAVEGLVRTRSGESGFATGVKALLTKHDDLHPALLGAIDKIHGWSSDAKAIRHAGKEDQTEPDLALARFMLVWCSAFMGYLDEPRR